MSRQDISFLSRFFQMAKQIKHRVICSKVEQGVANPTWNKETGVCLLMKKATGILTKNAPTMPCSMTNLVYSMPLKKPIKQNRKQVKRQSMAYAFRYSAEALTTSASLANMVDNTSPWK